MKINFTGNQPVYKHESDAGADLRAAESLRLPPLHFAKIKTELQLKFLTVIMVTFKAVQDWLQRTVSSF